LVEQLPSGFDQVVISVGGGGLCSGVAAALKQHPLTRGTEILAVEPEGADAMSQSLAGGRTVRLDRVETIADSLGSPVTLPYSFAVCRKFVDDLLLISDKNLVDAMTLVFNEFSMLVEPACAAGLATVLKYPEKFRNKKTVLLFCGSNTDVQSWVKQTG